MDDLSLHILDLAENSITSGAKLIEIRLFERPARNSLKIEITDDGCGMDEEMAKAALDPFVTTKKNKRIGLGLPLLAESARAAAGNLTLKSAPQAGTTVTAIMQYDHIDRKPVGDMVATLTTLIVTHPEVDFVYVHLKGDRRFRFTTSSIKRKLGLNDLNSARAIRTLKDALLQGETNLDDPRALR